MKKDEYGVWETTVQPLGSGACAIPHDSKVKVIHFHILNTLFILNQLADLDDSSIWSAY